MWEGLASLPVVFTDGRPLDRRVTPWLLNGLIRSHMPRLREMEDQPPMVWLQWRLCPILGWAIVPLTLLLLWARYLVVHDWFWTTIHVLLLAINIGTAIHFYQPAKATLRGEWQGTRGRRRLLPLIWETLF